MNVFRRAAGLAVLFAALAMVSCGDKDTAEPAKTTAKGVISGFGNMHVNGIQYATDTATVTMDGVPATINNLQVGMVVTVKGTINADRTAGVATAIEFCDLLQGPVSAIDPEAGTITIFGQTIRVDKETFYAHFSGLAALNVGDIVEVSGFPDGAGAIMATYLDKKTPLAESELKGQVTGPVAAKAFTVQIVRNSPPVKVSSSSAIDPLIKVGSWVAVTIASAGSGGATVTATGVRRRELLPIANGERVEMEGYITELKGVHGFQVNEITVTAGGVAAAKGLTAGGKVTVSGTMSNGLLLATTIEKEQKSDVTLGGEVYRVAPGTLTLNLQGCTVFVNERTAFRDDSSRHDRNFGLEGVSGVKAGDYLEVSGELGGNNIIATKIVRKNRQ